MRILLAWTRRVAMYVVLAGAGAGSGLAETTISQSNDPTAGLNGQMSALLGQERAAMGALAAGRLEQLLTAPAKPAQEPVAEERVASQSAVAPQPKSVPAKPKPFWALAGNPEADPGAASPDLASPDAVTIQYDAAWLASLPVAKGDQQWECLAKAVYFEARGESVRGQAAVAEVIMNRAASGAYPGSLCGVVHQGSKYACQFSFVCDGYSDRIREQAAYVQVGKIAALMIAGAPRMLTDGATHFHTGAVKPRWSRTFPRTAKIGAHYFYRQPIRLASN